ncbi:MAG: efflux RND transporter periplasmic adaptor subunit [Tannerella sp.]|jgi:RND family efflux transporter MFP subunit|nr:efflux RND transporter periplasmic adaptor subunit [Tannerella sp.]
MKIFYFVVVIFIALISSSCGHNHNQVTDEHDHAHDETIQLTAYGEDFEAFAEATPFVVGQPSDILVHFSHLENFKPLAEGSVTISLIVGTDGIRQTLEQPMRTGIYLFRLTPTVAGAGKIILNIEMPKGKSQIVVPDITVYTSEHAAHEAAAETAIESANGVVFTKEQSWKVDFATDIARREPFGQIIRTTAQILPSQGDQRIITANTNGKVFFSNESIVEGKAISAGKSLFFIDASDLADNNLAVRLVEAESEYNRTKAGYERKTELAKENIVSQSELLQAQTDFANAEANYNNLHRNFSTGRQSISSPINGFATRILVHNGQYVEAGQQVLVVSQNRDLFIKADLQPGFFDILDNVVSANIRTLNNSSAYTLEELNGRMVSYGKSTDMNNPLIPVIFQVNNKAGLLAGSFVELFIKTQTNAQAVTVPNESLIEEMGNYFVFAQLTPELFEKRAVKKGVTDGIRTEIIDGVSAGERVVSKGAILVKLAQTSAALDPHAGHVH